MILPYNNDYIIKTTYKRNFKKFNNELIDEYESLVDDAVNGTVGESDAKEMGNKFSTLLIPIVGLTYAKSRTSDIKNKLEINKNVNNSSKMFNDKLNENLINSVKKINELNIDKQIFNDARKNGLGISESLAKADLSKSGNYAVCSEKLLQQSLINQQRMMESKSDYYYNTNLLDGNGDLLYTTKTWEWSGLENTRHTNMDNLTIPINESFVVLNEVNGDIDYMMYPRDENADPSNSYNCGCDISYGNEVI